MNKKMELEKLNYISFMINFPYLNNLNIILLYFLSMVECPKKIIRSETLICITFYMYFIYIIDFLLFIVLSIYGIVLLCINDINLLWYNLLTSIVVTNITNFSLVCVNDKKKCNIKLIGLNSIINCVLSTLTIINIYHHNYADNLLYNCIVIVLSSQYIFMLCDLFLINMHYICDSICN